MGVAAASMLIAAAVGSGLIGGLFFAFSTFVMQALDRLPAAQAVAAMQTINVTVLNPLFFLAFFGTALVSAILLFQAVMGWGEASPVWIGAGAMLYLLGAILVTIVFNVPLNDQLAAVAPNADQAAAWRAYFDPWTFWNHVRTLASLAAAGCFCAALLGA